MTFLFVWWLLCLNLSFFILYLFLKNFVGFWVIFEIFYRNLAKFSLLLVSLYYYFCLRFCNFLFASYKRFLAFILVATIFAFQLYSICRVQTFSFKAPNSSIVLLISSINSFNFSIVIEDFSNSVFKSLSLVSRSLNFRPRFFKVVVVLIKKSKLKIACFLLQMVVTRTSKKVTNCTFSHCHPLFWFVSFKKCQKLQRQLS